MLGQVFACMNNRALGQGGDGFVEAHNGHVGKLCRRVWQVLGKSEVGPMGPINNQGDALCMQVFIDGLKIKGPAIISGIGQNNPVGPRAAGVLYMLLDFRQAHAAFYGKVLIDFRIQIHRPYVLFSNNMAHALVGISCNQHSPAVRHQAVYGNVDPRCAPVDQVVGFL